MPSGSDGPGEQGPSVRLFLAWCMCIRKAHPSIISNKRHFEINFHAFSFFLSAGNGLFMPIKLFGAYKLASTKHEGIQAAAPLSG